MTLWIILAAMTLAAIILTLLPLLRSTSKAANEAEYDLAVYKDQLEEIERDLERSLISPEQAASARLEIQRRMLAAAGRAEAEAANAGTGRRNHAGTVMAVVVAIPLGAALVYGTLGSPQLPGQPYAERLAARLDMPREQVEEMMALVERLAERMAEQPDNAEGWAMLGRSYRALGKYAEAADALREAVLHGYQDAETLASLGEAIAMSNHGSVTPDAVRAFEAALVAQPGEPRSRFYLGVARAQAEDLLAALSIWRDLEKDSRPDAPWVPMLRSQIQLAAAELGIDPETVPPAPPAVSSETSGALAGMSSQQTEMVENMVAGLAARLEQEPGDFEGWMRLGQSYGVLGREEAALDAYGKAMALDPQAVEPRLAYAEIALNQWTGEGELPEAVVTVLREVQALEPGNPEALFFIGLAEAQAGRPAEARRLWLSLREILPENSPARADLDRRLDALPTS
ncbi:c-type cytochrome biogenesis protein CcmI [Telmatospirillum sp. J64-1]|uniref:c-type cytochrome biogenesis protein CcmI n=1 Tax=Telmatospirillum sp. J64-1 TaxID=2502183 RepID=UPI00115E7890|nr:c-type cytochrome biogenesis protein CcmI [Telmatospirillum sp. J64-1]